jgi:hypothetical protein
MEIVLILLGFMLLFAAVMGFIMEEPGWATFVAILGAACLIWFVHFVRQEPVPEITYSITDKIETSRGIIQFPEKLRVKKTSWRVPWAALQACQPIYEIEPDKTHNPSR